MDGGEQAAGGAGFADLERLVAALPVDEAVQALADQRRREHVVLRELIRNPELHKAEVRECGLPTLSQRIHHVRARIDYIDALTLRVRLEGKAGERHRRREKIRENLDHMAVEKSERNTARFEAVLASKRLKAATDVIKLVSGVARDLLKEEKLGERARVVEQERLKEVRRWRNAVRNGPMIDVGGGDVGEVGESPASVNSAAKPSTPGSRLRVLTAHSPASSSSIATASPAVGARSPASRSRPRSVTPSRRRRRHSSSSAATANDRRREWVKSLAGHPLEEWHRPSAMASALESVLEQVLNEYGGDSLYRMLMFDMQKTRTSTSRPSSAATVRPGTVPSSTSPTKRASRGRAHSASAPTATSTAATAAAPSSPPASSSAPSTAEEARAAGFPLLPSEVSEEEWRKRDSATPPRETFGGSSADLTQVKVLLQELFLHGDLSSKLADSVPGVAASASPQKRRRGSLVGIYTAPPVGGATLPPGGTLPPPPSVSSPAHQHPSRRSVASASSPSAATRSPARVRSIHSASPSSHASISSPSTQTPLGATLDALFHMRDDQFRA